MEMHWHTRRTHVYSRILEKNVQNVIPTAQVDHYYYYTARKDYFKNINETELKLFELRHLYIILLNIFLST